MIERVVRVAGSFEEAARLDREDIARMSFEEGLRRTIEWYRAERLRTDVLHTSAQSTRR